MILILSQAVTNSFFLQHIIWSRNGADTVLCPYPHNLGLICWTGLFWIMSHSMFCSPFLVECFCHTNSLRSQNLGESCWESDEDHRVGDPGQVLKEDVTVQSAVHPLLCCGHTPKHTTVKPNKQRTGTLILCSVSSQDANSCSCEAWSNKCWDQPTFLLFRLSSSRNEFSLINPFLSHHPPASVSSSYLAGRWLMP